MTPDKILRIATRQKNLLTCLALLVLVTVLALFTQAPVGFSGADIKRLMK
ncbi:MAG: hypothetical protein P8J45_02970 [Phycisphaerales bacterium]|nr:hypothetical protein [Phycisphaerales bacterium]